MTFRFSLLLTLALWGPSRLWGQALMDTTVVLPDITVTATRTATRSENAPGRVTVLGARTLDATASRSVADVLAARAGAFVRRYGPGGLATLALRGANASQTLVLLDGFRIADPQLGQIDLSLLPAVLLASVEVAHGGGSALYGSDAVGGIINLHSLRAAGPPALRFEGAVGAYGARQGSGVVSGKTGRLTGLVSFEKRNEAGDFPFVNAALFPPKEVRREGADERHSSLYTTVGYEAGRHRTTVAAWYNDVARGLPGPGALPPKGERQWDRSLRLWMADRIRLARGTLRIGGLVQRASLRYLNPQLALDQTGRTFVASTEAEVRLALGAHWLAGGGLTASYGRARHPGLRDDAAERHVGAFVHATAEYGRLRLFPALRADVYTAPEAPTRASLNPRLGLNIELLSRLRLKAEAARTFRTPTFNDRFWQPGGDPGLRPEHGWTFDAGLMLHPRVGAQFEVTAFTHRMRDQIRWRPVPEGYWAPANLSRVRTRGLEVSGEMRLRPAHAATLDGGFFYTFTDARDRSDPAARSFDQPLRYVPRHQLKVHGGGGWHAVSLNAGARYTGRRFVTTDGSQSLTPYWVVDGQMAVGGRIPHARISLALSAENLLNRAYEGIKGYPMPPRSFRLRLRIDLTEKH